jgi:hypothetical protein
MIRWWMIAVIATVAACAPIDEFFGAPVLEQIERPVEVTPQRGMVVV